MNGDPGFDNDGGCRNVHRRGFIVLMARTSVTMPRRLALALFLVLAAPFELSFYLAVAIPILLLVLATVMTVLVSFAVAAFVLPGVGGGGEWNCRDGGRDENSQEGLHDVSPDRLEATATLPAPVDGQIICALQRRK